MTKAARFEAMSKEFEVLARECKIPNEVAKEVQGLIEKFVAPKAGGAVVDIETVVKRDGAGKITTMQCSLSGKWLPANLEHFYANKAAKEGDKLGGLKRLSMQGEQVRKQFAKVHLASKNAITNDIITKAITVDEGKRQLDKLEQTIPDFSGVKALVAK